MDDVPKLKRRIVVEETIAEGGYSVVHLGRDENTFERLAIKDIDLRDDNGEILFTTEVKVMKKLPDHRNLPKLLGHSRVDGVGSVVMTYLPYPTLANYIQDRGALPTDVALYILTQLVDVIGALAEAGIVHRDIKTDNILINPVTKRIRLIDFGLALYKKNLTNETYSKEFIGTPIYMSPALIGGRYHRLVASDLWSAGIVMWECLIGHHPFYSVATPEELLEIFSHGFEFSCFQPLCQVVLTGLLSQDEELRSGVEDLLDFLQNQKKVPPSQRTSISHNLLHAFKNRKMST